MPENATATLANEAIDEKQPPGPNADAVMQAAAAAGGDSGSTSGGQIDLPGVPAPDPTSAGASVPDTSGFDPTIHETGPDGKGIKNVDGSWRNKRGRKPQRDAKGHFTTTAKPAATAYRAVEGDAMYTSPQASPAAVPAAAADSAPSQPLTEEMARLAAEHYVGLALNAAQGLFGDEWKPDEAAEKEGLVTATANYLYATQAGAMSPGFILLLIAGGYGFKRVQRPNTFQRIKLYAMWIRRWLFGR